MHRFSVGNLLLSVLYMDCKKCENDPFGNPTQAGFISFMESEKKETTHTLTNRYSHCHEHQIVQHKSAIANAYGALKRITQKAMNTISCFSEHLVYISQKQGSTFIYVPELTQGAKIFEIKSKKHDQPTTYNPK